MQSFQELLPKFEQYMKGQVVPVQPAQLYQSFTYLLNIGGKRVRPIMCLMANELFGDIGEDAMNAAYAIELFHNFTLAHDDIMDKAPLRRGQATVHTKYNMPTAILCGDVICIFAYEYLNKINASNLKTIYTTFNKTAIEICEGQQMDMDFETQDEVHIDEYIQMITLKTSVLLACSMKIGALLGGATEGAANYLYEAGKNIGIAFQLKDDYLDTFGDGNKTGKQVGGDILANKKTFLLISAFEQANDEQKIQLNNLLKRNDEHKVAEMKALFLSLKVDEIITKQKEFYSSKAFEYISSLPVPNARKEKIIALAEELLLREN
jgi:geranylgeranyl diphosphate synthase type II